MRCKRIDIVEIVLLASRDANCIDITGIEPYIGRDAKRIDIVVERNSRPDVNGATGECNSRPNTNGATGGRNSRRVQIVPAGRIK